MDEGVVARARAWLAADPETRAELFALIEAHDLAALDDRFATRLRFGTAGLRGEIGAGSNRMNRVLVRVAAHAVFRHLSGLARQKRCSSSSASTLGRTPLYLPETRRP